MNRTEVHNRFQFHPATEQTAPQHDYVRELFTDTADELLDRLPEGRHKSLALTALQEAMMWSNAAIACDSETGALNQ